jgi:hypothetical protein
MWHDPRIAREMRNKQLFGLTKNQKHTHYHRFLMVEKQTTVNNLQYPMLQAR